MTDNAELFQTSDLSLCAGLICSGYKLVRICKKKDKRAIFLIKKDTNLDFQITKYFNHQLKVDALTFFNSMKELKTRIYHT